MPFPTNFTNAIDGIFSSSLLDLTKVVKSWDFSGLM